MRRVLAVLVLALALEWARGEWVQVPVIDGRKQATTTTTTPGPKGALRPASVLHPAGPAGPDGADLVGAPGPSADDVITIRRTVGDSFSNKQGVVPGPRPAAVEAVLAGAAEGPEPVDGHGAEAEGEADGQADGLSLRVLREAHQTLLRQSTVPVSGKLEFLRHLKNRMLRHIASLIPASALGLVGAAATGRSTGRALGAEMAEGRGHKGVGFPSNESTLMSLAFLVFAVFLVKVVMQLIYAVQNSQAANTMGVRVAQMQLPGGGVSNMMGTMMSMVPAMMPPMMAAMNPAMGMGGMRRARRDAKQTKQADKDLDEDVDRMTSRVLDAIQKARARVEQLGEGVVMD
ncbi:uncharacterized protein LOC117651195 [Thrips palmi]|uniref:Uncharacterized protein LOC117651195 n=1 Tax=Thrips palmi TaxID=161013 RepID=A0A6P9A271_THRPL|nr:uncharacterized protein LOC117651195 [Thrips palmi]